MAEGDDPEVMATRPDLEAVLAVADRETQRRRRWVRAWSVAAFAWLASVFSLQMVFLVGHTRHWWPRYTAWEIVLIIANLGVLPIVGAMMFGRSRMRKSAGALLAVTDTRAVGALVDALAERSYGEKRHMALAEALTRLLPMLDTAAEGEVDSRRLTLLARELAIAASYPELPQETIRFVVASIEALGRIGDRTSLGAVEKLAQVRQTAIREAALTVVPGYRARLQEAEAAQALLRPSAGPEGVGLLRPAGGGEGAEKGLLRVAEGPEEL